PATTYYFIVEACDALGNPAAADNGGNCFSFTTLAPQVGLVENFDTQPDNWTRSGLWYLSTPQSPCVTAASSPNCYHYARQDTCTYNTGAANRGSLISPEFIVPPFGELTFLSREQTEGTTTWDRRTVYVLVNGGTVRLPLAQLSGSGWSWYAAGPFSLAAYAGQPVALEFEFNTVDSYLNDFAGWAIDDVVVESADKLRVSEGSLHAEGLVGGPFAPDCIQFVLWNKGTNPLDWDSSTTVEWVDVSQTSGTLLGGETTTVTVSLNGLTATLPEGYHQGFVSFFNTATNLPNTREVWVVIKNPPAAPSQLRLTHATQTTLALAWADNSGNETTFVLERDCGTGFETLAELPPDTSAYVDSGLTPDTAYAYRVIARNAWGDSAPSNVCEARTLPWPPEAPTALRATHVNQAAVWLAWSDQSANETAFELQRDKGDGFELIATLPPDSETYVDSGLDADATLRYRVRAVNAGGASAWSEELEVRTLPWAPAIPLRLEAQLVGDRVELAWVDAATNETAFEVEWRTSTGAFVNIASLPENTSRYTHNAPCFGDRNTYRVRAVNAGGASDWSNEASVVLPRRNTFDDGPQGWTLHGLPTEDVGGDFDTTHGALRLWVRPADEPRILGWQSPRLPLSGNPDTIYRFKAYVFRANQAVMKDPWQVPNMRLRCSVRYAMNSMLEMFWHLAVDPATSADMLPNVPSADPSQPTVYRVDLDPVDVPLLDPAVSPTDGVQGMYEVYSLEPQENGALELAEAILMALPAPTNVRHLKTYATSPTDAGDFSRAAFMRWTLGGSQPLPTVDDSTTYGLVLDTTACSAGDVAVAVAEINPGDDLAQRVRIEPGRQYRVRWHVVSPRESQLQSQLRLRVRTLRFSWSQKFELGGAWAAGPLNNAIAQQVLPGVGTANPDKRGDELAGLLDGGWFTMYFHGPNVVPAAQPGPGIPAASRRDIKCGVDTLDTISSTPNASLEGGLFFVDQIEIADFETLPD
ncbi:MAG: hypothetical protein N2Z21_08410, partial [Candidatus Sumerlaeaceae bacterium]|nr:hypothetical protein [Candidatus Sumerlaeaceae bacterium]